LFSIEKAIINILEKAFLKGCLEEIKTPKQVLKIFNGSKISQVERF